MAHSGVRLLQMTRVVHKLIYVGDPMCSWCWGFAPEIDGLADEFPVEVLVGGLRPGPSAQVLDDRMASSLRHHWREVAERTGQPFDESILCRRDGWVYDTEPADIAVVVMREMSQTATLPFFTTIQHAFYADGLDVTDLDILTELATGFEIDTGDFSKRLASTEAKKSAWADFSLARRWGISGFPALIGEIEDDRLALLTRGWTTADVIRARIGSLDEAAAG